MQNLLLNSKTALPAGGPGGQSAHSSQPHAFPASATMCGQRHQIEELIRLDRVQELIEGRDDSLDVEQRVSRSLLTIA
jgi:hypothetical protein